MRCSDSAHAKDSQTLSSERRSAARQGITVVDADKGSCEVLQHCSPTTRNPPPSRQRATTPHIEPAKAEFRTLPVGNSAHYLRHNGSVFVVANFDEARTQSEITLKQDYQNVVLCKTAMATRPFQPHDQPSLRVTSHYSNQKFLTSCGCFSK